MVAQRSSPMNESELREKIGFIVEQTRTASKLEKPFIHCECRRDIPLVLSYRCLYCGQWYCRKCAEKHFGKTVQQYRKENPLPDCVFDTLAD